MRTTSDSAWAGVSQYAGFLAKRSASSWAQLTNLQGPVPIVWTSHAPDCGATIEATGIARNLGNTASGCSSVRAIAVSPTTSRPETCCAVPAAYSFAPRIGSNGQARPPVDFGSSTRRKLVRTAAAVTGVLSAKRMPGRRWKT